MGVTVKASKASSAVFQQTGLKTVDVDARDWATMLYDEKHWTHLPFTHGMETELALTDDAGNYLPGEEMVYRMKECSKEAKNILVQIIEGTREDFFPNGGLVRDRGPARMPEKCRWPWPL